MKDLNSISKTEQCSFFNSFDLVLFDIDGVLWTVLDRIPHAQDAVRLLQKMGKQTGTVSNNGTTSVSLMHANLKSFGFNFEKDSVVIPPLAMVAYLKKIKFNKKLFVVGMNVLKSTLSEAGFEVVDSEYKNRLETFKEFALATAADYDDVGAVIFDADFNMTHVELQKSCAYLQRPETLFLVGIPDKEAPISQDRAIISSGYFHQILEDMTGKKPIVLAKPAKYFGEFLVEWFKVKDRSRVLFVGDSIPSDMGLAAVAGFKKLLVLSGVTNMNDVLNWSYPEDYKPDYYVQDLGTVYDILHELSVDKLLN